MAYTQADIDQLKKALATGASRVRIDGEEVQYRSRAEMERQLRIMEAEVSGSTTKATVSYPVTSRGF